MTAERVRWAIAGTGKIAAKMASALASVPDAELVAVCSRTPEAAETFARRHGVGRSHGSYEALAADPDVDVVYVATPNQRHRDDTVAFLDAGHHVVCEKPMALDAAQVRAMAEAARASGRFLMEALWSRFLPPYQQIATLVGDGRIGEPLHVEASFGFPVPFDPAHRLYNLALGGGSLLDLGIYPVNLAHFLLGAPTGAAARAHVGPTGVDEHTAAVLEFPGGALAQVSSSICASLSCTAQVIGTEGRIDIPAFMHHPEWFDLTVKGVTERVDTPLGPDPLRYQVVHVNRCLSDGLVESPVMPVAASLDIASVLDQVRSQIGVVYP